jgi:DNA-binding transcriptional LysR family regulator
MNPIDLRGLEIFLAVCETGGLTSAARSLDLTQAAVSQHLAKIERELGVQLVDRSIRPQQVTPAGHYLRQRARKLFAEFDDIRAGVARYKERDIPELHIGLVESIAVALLPHLVAGLKGRVGSLSITSGTTHPLMPELRDGAFDMIVTTELPDGIDDAQMMPLITEPLLLVLPKTEEAPLDWEGVAELAARLEFVRFGRKRRLSRIIDHQFARFGIQPHGTLEFDSSFAIIDRVRKGLGWAVSTPLCVFAAGASREDVTLIPFPSSTPVRCVNLVWMSERGSGPARLVGKACREIFETLIIPELQARAPGLEDRVAIAQ